MFLLMSCVMPAALALPRQESVPGGVALLRLADRDAAPPRAWFQEKPVLVWQRGDGWYALVGLPLTIEPGVHALRTATAQAAPPREESLRFEVQPKAYPVQHVRIKDKRKVTPPPEDMERIEREQKTIADLKNHWRNEAQVDLAFALPADGPLSSRFGLRRVFNGEPRQPHSGLDVAVAAGTPVRSAAAGRVLNTGDYFFNGSTVFVDHGQGLITMYCHLQRIDVHAGEKLARGQQVGLAGASGRASGPHLHWSVFLNGTAVDPELLIQAR